MTSRTSASTKTIFVTSFQGLVSRVLESGVLAHLTENPSVRVVLFVPDFKIEYFKKAFGAYPRVTVEGVSRASLPRRSFLFYKLSFMLLHTRTMSLVRRSFRGYKHWHEIFFAEAAAHIFGSTKPMRELFRAANYYFSGKEVFGAYFEKYRPDLVFSTDVKEVLDAQLLIEAKRRGVRTVGMVRSWDYLTGKGMTRVKPDTMVVHNDTIKQEAIDYADMDADDVAVVGIPHYDPYMNEKRSERDIFFKRIGVDPSKRLVLYAPWGGKFLDTDWQFLRMLNDAIDAGELPADLHIVVRMPPGDSADRTRFPESGRITVDMPGVSFPGEHRKANEMSYADLLHLADLLFYSVVVVSSPSTMVIDACAFDTPSVLLAFDGDQDKSYFNGVRHYFDFNHVANLVRQGGATLVKNKHALIASVRAYLEDQSLNIGGREVVRREQCFLLDGQSSKRLADFLFSQIF